MLIVRRRAERAIQNAYSWYQSKRTHLGIEFITEIEKTFRQIESHPNLFPVVYKNIKRALCHRFPYSIYFLTTGQEVIILAVLHQRQMPPTL